MERPGESPPGAVLVYDGSCPLCRAAVARIGRLAAPGAFEFLSCRSEELPRRFPSIDRAACLAAMHLVLPDGTVLAGEKALPGILRRLPRYRWAAALFRLPGAGFFSRLAYRWIAGHRYRLFRS